MNEESTSKSFPFPVICLSVAVMASIAGYFSGIQPVIENTHASMVLDARLNNQTHTLSQKYNTVSSQEKSLAKLMNDISANQINLLPSSHRNNQIAQITQLADQMGVTIQKIKPENAITGQHYQTIPINLSGAGTYRSCTHFFNSLHANYNDVGIASFEMIGNPSKPDGSATFKANIHWFARPH